LLLRLVNKIGNMILVRIRVESTALVIYTGTIGGAPSVEGVGIDESVTRALPWVLVIQRVFIR